MNENGTRHVVYHAATSLDGCTVGFEADMERFYELVKIWDEDVTLTGADTILSQEEVLANAPQPGPDPEGPLVAVVDTSLRVKQWQELRDCGRWSGTIALRSNTTEDGPDEELVAGDGDRVDLGAALEELSERGLGTVRVDSGGALAGALFEQGLIDELSLLVHPLLMKDQEHRWFGSSPPDLDLESIPAESPGGGLAWLRYAVRN